MKKTILLLVIVLLLYSCHTLILPKEELKWNYKMIDRIVQNPDSLNFFLRDPVITSVYSSNYEKDEKLKLIKMVINKLKNNDYKDGYSIVEEKIEDKSYEMKDYYNKGNDYRSYTINLFFHSMFIKSNKTGKKVFFMFRNLDNRNWEIFDIHTIIISKDSILEY